MQCYTDWAPILCNLFVVSLAHGNGTEVVYLPNTYRVLSDCCILLIYGSFPCWNVYISIAFVLAPLPQVSHGSGKHRITMWRGWPGCSACRNACIDDTIGRNYLRFRKIFSYYSKKNKKIAWLAPKTIYLKQTLLNKKKTARGRGSKSPILRRHNLWTAPWYANIIYLKLYLWLSI